MHVLNLLLDLLNKSEKKKLVNFVFLVFIMSLFDMIGVASIMPFIAVLADPEIIDSNVYLRQLYSFMSFNNDEAFLSFLGLVVFITLVITIIFKAFVTYLLTLFVREVAFSLGLRFVKGYLNQTYEWFLNRNSSDLGKTVLSEVEKVVVGTLSPITQIAAQGSSALALVVVLVIANPLLSIIIAGVLIFVYVLVYVLLRGKLSRIGVGSLEDNTRRYQILSEAFGGIKEVKVLSLEAYAISRFEGPSKRFSGYIATSQAAASLPRYFLEVFVFGGMLLVVLFLLRDAGTLEKALPYIALYAFAGYRLIPALQGLYAQIVSLRFVAPSLDKLNQEMNGLLRKADTIESGHKQIQLSESLELKSVTYFYPGSDRPSLKNLNISIKAGSRIGLIGASGAGKSTVIDIILGLLKPTKGMVLIDDEALTNSNENSWRSQISYVSQTLFLTDDTIASNIAFGVEKEELDMSRVEQAIVMAQLKEMIDSLPLGVDTLVGERGVRLSGGERQRIALARAFYRRPKILILDEATSALDNITESKIMDSIDSLGRDVTMIIIAHRISTVKSCDKIYLINSGEVVATGNYEELLSSNESFQTLVNSVN